MTFISMHSVIICVVLPWRTYETHRLYPLNMGVTSTKCKTGISVVLTVMSDSNTHMINLWN
jgi:hypothetical protein